MLGRWTVAVVGVLIIIVGGLIAHFTQTAGGIKIQDIRFKGAKGNTMSALLYVPPNATREKPAPGILAVHGYINSRETQAGFAIEFARRGYVVLALDQTGHGYSDPPAFANGFGGPDALTYLRGLDFVDKGNIGLEGHSMGGWTILAAATAMPNDYKAMVLEGSSTGRPFAADGTPTWPRNVALVFSQYDEFSQLMWGVPRARDAVTSPKLLSFFGTTRTGRARQGLWRHRAGQRARALRAGDLACGRPHLARSDRLQPRLVREDAAGRHAAAVERPDLVPQGIRYAGGAGGLHRAAARRLPGAADAAGVRSRWRNRPPRRPRPPPRDRKWWTALLLTALVPALIYYPVLSLSNNWIKPQSFMPQNITNQIAIWALVNALLTLALLYFAPKRTPRTGIVVPSILIAAGDGRDRLHRRCGWPISSSRSTSASGSSR